MKVLIGCEFSQVITKAFRARGHEVYSCDIVPEEGSHPEWHFQEDVLKVVQDKQFDLAIFHPPCTYLATSGNKWFYHSEDKHLPVSERRPHPKFPDRQSKRRDALKFFMALVRTNIPRVCIENPVGVTSSIWKKPTQYIQPFYFGHPATKKTCLWLKGLPRLKATKIVKVGYVTFKSGKRMSKWHYETGHLPLKERAKARSITFQGVADAMADQWNF